MAVRAKDRGLSVVSETGGALAEPVAVEAPPQTLSARIKQLQAEARELAREHVRSLEAALVEVERLSAEIASGGDAYPNGVREVARRLLEDCQSKRQTLGSLKGRT